MKKAKKRVDMAFKQSLHLICERFGIEVWDLTVIVKFVGDQIHLIVFNKHQSCGEISLQSLIGSKMMGIGMTIPALEFILRSIQGAFTTGAKFNNPDDVSLILYDSAQAQKPCVSIFVEEEPQQTLVISEVVDVLEIGAEQFN